MIFLEQFSKSQKHWFITLKLLLILFQVLDILGERFGYTKNKKGYKVLPPYVRIIQGDGISYETLEAILMNMKNHNWSADNAAFGSGGALLQRLDRDTQKCAFKCSYAIINSKEVRSRTHLKLSYLIS